MRKSGSSRSIFQIYGLSVDTAGGVVKKDGKEVFLSALEYRLLLVFINNPQSIITRDRLLDELCEAAGILVLVSSDTAANIKVKGLDLSVKASIAVGG